MRVEKKDVKVFSLTLTGRCAIAQEAMKLFPIAKGAVQSSRTTEKCVKGTEGHHLSNIKKGIPDE